MRIGMLIERYITLKIPWFFIKLCILQNIWYLPEQDLKDERRRDDIAAARATLKKNSIMLLTTSKVTKIVFVVLCQILCNVLRISLGLEEVKKNEIYQLWLPDLHFNIVVFVSIMLHYLDYPVVFWKTETALLIYGLPADFVNCSVSVKMILFIFFIPVTVNWIPKSCIISIRWGGNIVIGWTCCIIEFTCCQAIYSVVCIQVATTSPLHWVLTAIILHQHHWQRAWREYFSNRK